MSRAIKRWVLRGAAGTIGVLATLALVGSVYQHRATKADFNKMNAPGQLISVGKQTFHIHCSGEGSIAVILEGGAGTTTQAWAWIQPEISKRTRVCSYDRAGYGWSTPSEQPMDALNTSRKLHDLLRAANIPSPYILVGHSIGGAYARMFTANYTDEVAGLFLIDATSPAVLDTYAEVGLPKVEDWTPWSLRVFPYLAYVGGMRLLVALGIFDLAKGLPADAEVIANAFLSTPEHIRMTIAEYAALSETLKQIRALQPHPSLPVAIVSAARFPGLDKATEAAFVDWHHKQQKAWLRISSTCSFRIVDGSDHVSLVTSEAFAHEIAVNILEMVEAVSKP
ncbi:alpha/beta hydrolase [Methylosinus sp. PW1]|uniref:alpha/beta hydrolase n=1 Tax=Methylosinus sp. PW1 TaxID=107636 RepID=UPI0018DE6E83|nr:alpha/beta hydrolase [Methylosinus sp. PW1]